jgi:zinc D-Ala-D-Ala carboxypeptidase
MTVKLSPNFTLAELTASATAKKLGLDNAPLPEHLENLKRLAALLEEIRALLNAPIKVNSAYRSPAVNAAVGGVPNSRHALGLAADIVCPTYGSPLQVARAIDAAGLGYDQLIHEFGRWVHVGLSPTGVALRHQAMTICTREAGYLDGLLACA